MFKDRFGEPTVGNDPDGPIYRWRLERPNWLNIHLIIDTPSVDRQAHVMVSDPCPEVPEQLRSFWVETDEEVQRAMDDIEDQWHLRGCWKPVPARSL